MTVSIRHANETAGDQHGTSGPKARSQLGVDEPGQ
jgi:hypothetical protein